MRCYLIFISGVISFFFLTHPFNSLISIDRLHHISVSLSLIILLFLQFSESSMSTTFFPFHEISWGRVRFFNWTIYKLFTLCSNIKHSLMISSLKGPSCVGASLLAINYVLVSRHYVTAKAKVLEHNSS